MRHAMFIVAGFGVASALASGCFVEDSDDDDNGRSGRGGAATGGTRAGGSGGALGGSGGAEGGSGGAEAGSGGAAAGSGGAAGGAAGAASGGDGGSAGDQSGNVGPIIDPAPEATTPGEHASCTGSGPTTNVSRFALGDVTESSVTLEGTVTGASGAGTYFVSDGTQAISGEVGQTAGAFDVTVPLFCGNQTIKLVWSEGDCDTALVYSVNRTGCTEPDIRATLTWDNLGNDWELHLVKPGGRINDPLTDCTWNTCYLRTPPDWGVSGDTSDDPVKDVDDVDTYGPENIYLSKPESGVYTVMVEHWGSGSPEADGTVVLNVAGEVYESKIQNLPWGSVWTAATIEWPSGRVTVNDAVYDCSQQWETSCAADIP